MGASGQRENPLRGSNISTGMKKAVEINEAEFAAGEFSFGAFFF
jgi:hypothetical protein